LLTVESKPTADDQTMKVNDPIDDVELSYAIEALCIEAQEHDMERHEIIDVLERTTKAVKDEQLV